MGQSDTGTDREPAGFYGKLPALGDFVTRRLPTQFVQVWDQWLRESLAASRTALGDDWLDTYLTSPLWRFALTPGIAGQRGWAGVLMPSVDRVGRYFPLTLARPLDQCADPFRELSSPGWFELAELAALASLDDGLTLERFEAAVLALPAPGSATGGRSRDTASPSGRDAWQIEAATPADLSKACPVLLSRALEEVFFAYSLWWTSGSERIAPSLLACQGLPAPDAFVALLAGDWAGRGWMQLGGP
jgi:type VI secretion system protein ImpM